MISVQLFAMKFMKIFKFASKNASIIQGVPQLMPALRVKTNDAFKEVVPYLFQHQQENGTIAEDMLWKVCM